MPHGHNRGEYTLRSKDQFVPTFTVEEFLMLKKIVVLMGLAFFLGTAVALTSDPGPLPECYPCSRIAR